MAYTLVCLILLGWVGSIHIVWGQTNEQFLTQNPACSSPACNCCLNPNTCNKNACGGQCINGIFGNKCLNYCPNNCASCKDAYNPTNNVSLWGVANCTSCQPGRYSTPEYIQCQFNCTTGCETCTSATDCTSCNDGYYLSDNQCFPCSTHCDSCTSTVQCSRCKDKYYKSTEVSTDICIACSNGCLDGKCNPDSGSCTCKSGYAGDKCDRCIDGKYDTANNCQYQCVWPCANCVSYDNCTSCVETHVLQGLTCQRCQMGCAQCTTPDSCSQCERGYFMSVSGIECSQCSAGCISQCNLLTGSCTCKTGFSGERCDQCAPNFQTYPQCNQCKVGFHGTDCDLVCPTNCKANVCEKDGGRCKYGCYGNFNGDNCTICNDGWYSTTCDAKCPENCRSTCYQSTGYCLGCTGNFTGDTCDTCINGKHGQHCNLTCPFNCYNFTCQRYSGHCNSCIQKFSGDTCCLEGPNCQSCSSESVCYECVQGKHGERCEKECPENCARKICDKVNGTCIPCADGFTGDNCTSTETASGPGIPVAAIAGGVIGCIVAIVVAVFVSFFKRRSSQTNTSTMSMRHPDCLTTERAYANDAAITAVSNGCNTYETLTSPNNSITDYEQLNLGASLKKGDTLTIDKTGVINKLNASMKSDTMVKQHKTQSLKPNRGIKSCPPKKAVKTPKMPKQSVTTVEREYNNDYYNIEASLKKGVAVSDLSS